MLVPGAGGGGVRLRVPGRGCCSSLAALRHTRGAARGQRPLQRQELTRRYFLTLKQRPPYREAGSELPAGATAVAVASGQALMLERCRLGEFSGMMSSFGGGAPAGPHMAAPSVGATRPSRRVLPRRWPTATCTCSRLCSRLGCAFVQRVGAMVTTPDSSL